MCICVYVYIYIYIYPREKHPVAPPLLAYSMMEKCVSPERNAPFQKTCCYIEGKDHFSKQASRLGHICVFKFMRCFAVAKQHFQHAHVSQKRSVGNQKPCIKPRQQGFHNQWIHKTIENTKNMKKTIISEPVGSQSNRKYKKWVSKATDG